MFGGGERDPGVLQRHPHAGGNPGADAPALVGFHVLHQGDGRSSGRRAIAGGAVDELAQQEQLIGRGGGGQAPARPAETRADQARRGRGLLQADGGVVGAEAGRPADLVPQGGGGGVGVVFDHGAGARLVGRREAEWLPGEQGLQDVDLDQAAGRLRAPAAEGPGLPGAEVVDGGQHGARAPGQVAGYRGGERVGVTADADPGGGWPVGSLSGLNDGSGLPGWVPPPGERAAVARGGAGPTGSERAGHVPGGDGQRGGRARGRTAERGRERGEPAQQRAEGGDRQHRNAGPSAPPALGRGPLLAGALVVEHPPGGDLAGGPSASGGSSAPGGRRRPRSGPATPPSRAATAGRPRAAALLWVSARNLLGYLLDLPYSASFSPVGSTGFVSGNATVGVASSGEFDRASADGFVAFGSDVSLTASGDHVPLDVPDDHGIRQRRRPNTVLEPSPGRPVGRLIALPSLFCHGCRRANQRFIQGTHLPRAEYGRAVRFFDSAGTGSGVCLAGRVSASQPTRPSG